MVKINLDGKLTAPGGAELGAWRWWGQEEYTFIWKDGKPDAAVISRDGNALSPSKTKASPGVAAVRSAPPTK